MSFASPIQASFQKRLSAIGQSLAGKLPTPSGSPGWEGQGSVPPSPQVPEFPLAPPPNPQSLQAARKLMFHFPDHDKPGSKESTTPGSEVKVGPTCPGGVFDSHL